MKNWFLGLFIFLWGYLSSGCAQNSPPADLPEVQDPAFQKKLTSLLNFTTPLISVDDLYHKIQSENWVILDAREREEFDVSHLPGARFAGYKDFNPNRWTQLPKDQPIAVYCSVGYRSEKIGQKLEKEGFTKVYNLYGSIFEWVNQGYPVVDVTGNATQKIHTYNKDWSRWVKKDGIVKIW